MYRMDKQMLARRVDEVLALVDLSQDEKKLVAKYSGGMRRRLALAAAALHNPKVLILDEPTVGIDPVLRHELWEELYRLAEDGVAILVTTHVMDEAEKCHRLAMMRGGRIIGEGSPKELKARFGLADIESVFLELSGKGGVAS
jgi:ABC-2 type transport system ATP-binding protein